MNGFTDCPIGFEDGSILKYEVESNQALLWYQFWNDRIAEFKFTGFVGLQDSGAVGVTVGKAQVAADSQLINLLLKRLYTKPPAETPWKEFRVLDTDGEVMFQVVAEACTLISLSGERP